MARTTRIFIAVLIAALCVAVPPLRADQIVLKNGDRITGTIVKKDGDKLTFTGALVGEITVAWDAIVSIEAETPTHVTLTGGKELQGPIATTQGQMRVADTTTPLTDVNTIRDDAEQRKYERLLSPGWLDLWAGYFDAGLALARGNARTSTVTSSAEAVRLTRSDKMRLYFNQIYSTATINGQSTDSAKAARGGLSYDHNITSRTYFNVFNDYEYDQFQNLDLRFVVGGGIGVHAIKSEQLTLDLLGGVSYNRESFVNHEVRKSAEAFYGDDLSYKLSGASSLTQSFRMFHNLSDLGAYRANFDFGTATRMRRWLSWQITVSDRYLSTPVFGRKKNDLLLSTGLRVTFAR
jgi:hypothetical protein